MKFKSWLEISKLLLTFVICQTIKARQMAFKSDYYEVSSVTLYAFIQKTKET